MAEYFLKLTKFFPTNSDPKYIGPFPRKDDAVKELDNAMSRVPFQIVTEDQKPEDFTKAVQVEVLPRIAARVGKQGLRRIEDGDSYTNVIGTTIPSDFIPVPEVVTQIRETGRTESTTGTQTKNEPIYENLEDQETNQDEEESIEGYQNNMQTRFDYMRNQPRPFYRGPNYPQTPQKLREQQADYANQDAPLIVVGNHPWNADWLESRGIRGQVVYRVNNIWEVQGRTVYGTIPLRLALHAAKVVSLDFKRMRTDLQNKPLTVEEMDEAGANLLEAKVMPWNRWQEIQKFLLDNGYEGEI